MLFLLSLEKALDFELVDTYGRSHKLSDYKGKVVVMDFWATWCPPCRKSIPFFKQIYEQYKDSGVVVLGISVDMSKRAVERFVKDKGVDYPVLLDRDNLVSDLYKVYSIPTTIIVDKKGNVVARKTGFSKEHERFFRKTIGNLIKEDACESKAC